MSDMEYKKYKLKELLTIKNGKDHKKLDNGSYPVYGSGGYMRSVDSFLYNDTSILLPRKGTLSNIQFISETPFWTVDTIYYTVLNENLYDPYYLYLYLNSLDLSGYDSGASIPSMTSKTYYSLNIELPEKRIQTKVANIIRDYDKLIENNNKRIRLLEKMAENLYKEWFVRFRFPGYENVEFEGGIPNGWKIVRLSDIADIIMGQSPESENYNTNCKGLPFHQGVGSYGDFYLIDDVYSTKGNRIAEANSIIFSVRAPVGRINITLNKIILGRGVAGINSIPGYNAYLLWMLKNQFQQEDIIGNGSIFASVTKKELFGFKILMPNEDLIQKFDSIASGIESEMRKITLINSNLKKQRDMLLPRLMSGKLEV